ncbi:MAG: winged helix-turn-helix transcriptional regulator [Acidimicrobiia bacterium]
MKEPEAITPFCPRYHRAMEILGGRWTNEIVRALLGGTARFSEFTATIPGLSDRLLSERLRSLEAEGIVTRTVVPDKPVRIEYQLTDKGRDLAAVVQALAQWAQTWVEPAEAPR